MKRRRSAHRARADSPAVRELPHCLRPREKLRRLGAEALNDRELLAVLLGSATRERSVLQVCEDLLPTGSGLPSLVDAAKDDLTRRTGLGLAGACRIEAALEIARRLASAPARWTGWRFDHPQRVFDHFRPRLGLLREEHVFVLLLDARHRQIAERTISRGSLMASILHPREIFRPAITLSAAALLLVHNHPSGDPSPSDEDRTVTSRVAAAGRVIGIPLLDHVIVGGSGYFSFRERSLLDADPLGP